MKTTYQQTALDFMKATGTKLTVKFINHDYYFNDDKQTRDIYRFRLSRNGQSYTAKFGQSISNSGYTNKERKEPAAYNILACITKYDPDTFENFCREYGYDTDSRSAFKTYKAVVKEWAGVDRLFNDVLDELREIN